MQDLSVIEMQVVEGGLAPLIIVEFCLLAIDIAVSLYSLFK